MAALCGAVPNAHVFAEVFEWLASAYDEYGELRDTLSLRATCRTARTGFDVAVHTGGIGLAGHDASVPDEAGASCRWVHGWFPSSLRVAARLDGARYAVRLEHCAMERRHRLGTWSAPHVIVCETRVDERGGCAAGGSTYFAKPFVTCMPSSVAFSLSPLRLSKQRLVSQLCIGSRLTSVDFSGLRAADLSMLSVNYSLPHVASFDFGELDGAQGFLVDRLRRDAGPSMSSTTITTTTTMELPADFMQGHEGVERIVGFGEWLRCNGVARLPDRCFEECPRLTSVNTDGMTSVTGVGNAVFHATPSLVELDLCGFVNATAIGTHFCSGAGLREVDATGLVHVRGALGSNFLASCPNLTVFRAGGDGLSRVSELGADFLGNCLALESFDVASGSASFGAVVKIGARFLAGAAALRSVDLTPFQALEELGSHCMAWCFRLECVHGLGPESGIGATVVSVEVATLCEGCEKLPPRRVDFPRAHIDGAIVPPGRSPCAES